MLSWSAQVPAFYTVHRVNNVFIDMIFQAGLGETHSETISAQDILEELRGTKPAKQEVLAGVMDCNNPYAIYLVVWDRQLGKTVADTDMITLNIQEFVIDKSNNKDFRIGLIDAEALFGSGYLTASMRFSRISDKLIPPGANPEDETFCLSRVTGLSAAGYFEGDSFGIVTGGRLKIGKPMATLEEFVMPPE
jgi:hypothetical protein